MELCNSRHSKSSLKTGQNVGLKTWSIRSVFASDSRRLLALRNAYGTLTPLPSCVPLAIQVALSRPILHLFEGIFERIVLPQIQLLPLLCRLVLRKDFLDMLCHKFPNESWIPQLARHTKILAAASKSCRLASFDCCGDTLGREVVLFTTGNGYEPIEKIISGVLEHSNESNVKLQHTFQVQRERTLL